MKIVTISLISLLTFSVTNIDCGDLADGKFRTKNANGSLTTITRKGNKQTEDYNNGERVSEFDVTWLSECEYIVFNRRVISGIDPWPEMNSDTLMISIIDIKEDYYLTESEMLSKGWKMNQKVEILEL